MSDFRRTRDDGAGRMILAREHGTNLVRVEQTTAVRDRKHAVRLYLTRADALWLHEQLGEALERWEEPAGESG